MSLLPGSGCPNLNTNSQDRIALAHGEGAKAMRRLLQERILPRFANVYLESCADAVWLPSPSGALAFSTDSYVVTPLFFPGGDIGKLSVCGTANDLAVSGAKPRWLSLAMIIEEGFPLELLEKILLSIATTAQQAEMMVVAGDTKVLPRGKTDGLFITTSGLGEGIDGLQSKPKSISEGDAVIVTGSIGRHGMAIMAAREPGFAEQEIVSDCGLLYPAVAALHNAGVQVRAMRDATRGGIASVLHEWASDCGLSFTIEEKQVPVDADVRGIAELLGIDPLLVANEGTMVIAVAESEVEKAIDVLRQTDIAAKATRIGYAKKKSAAAVCIRRGLGIEIALDEPSGAPLPRIC